MNIVLCGLKHAGKTTLAQDLAVKLSVKMVDTDVLIQQYDRQQHRVHRTIQEIYRDLGEEAFRDIEESVILALPQLSNTVISAGGGSLLRRVVVDKLCSYGKLIYLYWPLQHYIDLMNHLSLEDFLGCKVTQARLRLYYQVGHARCAMVCNDLLDRSLLSSVQCSDYLERLMTS